MRELYKKARDNMHTDGLKKENLLHVLNVILGRKRFKMTVCQVMTDWFLSIFPYRTLRKAPLSKETLERRRIFNKAS